MLLIFISIILLSLLIYFYYNNNYENYKNNTNLLNSKIKDILKQNKLKFNFNNHTITITNKVKKKMILKHYRIIDNNPSYSYLTDDKFICNTKLYNETIPIPKTNYFSRLHSHDDREEILNKMNIQYPLVVKPNIGEAGYKIYSKIKNKKELNIILTKYLNQKLNQAILLEEYIKGDLYNILMYKNTIIDVIKYNPSFIIGDGKHTIKQLIELKNKQIQQDESKIYKYKPDVFQLYQTKKNYDFLLPKNNKIINNSVNTTDYESITKIDIKNIHKNNIELFKKISKLVPNNIYTIDYLSRNISKSYKTNNGKILEINNNPNIYNFFYNNKKLSLGFFNNLIKHYFNTNHK